MFFGTCFKFYMIFKTNWIPQISYYACPSVKKKNQQNLQRNRSKWAKSPHRKRYIRHVRWLSSLQLDERETRLYMDITFSSLGITLLRLQILPEKRNYFYLFILAPIGVAQADNVQLSRHTTACSFSTSRLI